MAEQTEKKAPSKAKKPKKKDGFFKKVTRFFRDLRGEVKKVVSPDKKKVLNNSVAVLVIMGAVGAVIWVLDWVLAFVRGLALGF